MIETTIEREVNVRDGPMQGGYSTNIREHEQVCENKSSGGESTFKTLHQLITCVHKETKCEEW